VQRFYLTCEAIDFGAYKTALHAEQCGGYVAFEGWVRNHNNGKVVEYLIYETYAALALAEGERIISQAKAEFAITDAYCVHRYGTLHIGDMAIWVGVAAAHRDAAFAACRFILDQVKQTVPIWKQEFYSDHTPAKWLEGETRVQSEL
jgi:molybdopterin synthase catalytic subunit